MSLDLGQVGRASIIGADEMTPFHFECRGTRYPATYAIRGRFVDVVTPFGTHCAVIGLSDPQKLARAILRNAVQKHLASPTTPRDTAAPSAAASPSASL